MEKDNAKLLLSHVIAPDQRERAACSRRFTPTLQKREPQPWSTGSVMRLQLVVA
jgi:hypothetical protein